MSDIGVSALIMAVISKAYSHLHTSQVCAPCLQSAATAPPLLGHRSYRLLERDERGQYKRRRYYRRRKKKKGNKGVWLPCGVNCVPLQCVVAASHIHRTSTHAVWHSDGVAWYRWSCNININTFLPRTEKKPIMMENSWTTIMSEENRFTQNYRTETKR